MHAKKRLAAATVFLLLLWSAAANTPGSVQELAPGVFVRIGNRDRNQPANCGWVVFKDYVLVIDANFPWGAKEILPEIRKTTNKPIRFVFNTHYHGDHAYGSSVFVDQGAALVCSQDCAAESRSKGQAAWDRNTATGEYSLKPYRLEHPTVVFEKNMVFDDGDKRVELHLAGPGHSKGDAVAWLPKEKIVFTGDLCVNWKSGNNVADADADHENWLKALEKMYKAAPKTVVVGHGELGGADVLTAQHAYLSEMLTKVRAGIAAGKTADQLAKEIDLTGHKIGADPERNAGSVRAMHRRLAAKR
ncbi:MAG: MBL fold metallo-hydrolase [Bryobacterales bacterium]|nr:MBL fold metallo-hydrolase [Bryobacterales bacterium]